ncbi:hypothetical protein RQP46_008185 [Phenoliferia psychrophenolica]
MSVQQDAPSESGSPPVEPEADEAGSRCLITSLPAELLSMIHALVFSGLSLDDEQLERYHLQSVCRGFNSFFNRPNKHLIVANVDRAVALKKALKSSGRSTPKQIKLYLGGKGSSRSDKFAALISACDVKILAEVTLELGQTPLGVARAGHGHDWIGLPLRRALAKVQMEAFRLRVSETLRLPTLSVDVLEELLAGWHQLELLEIGSLGLTGTRTIPPAPPIPTTSDPSVDPAAAPPPPPPPFILPTQLIKLEVEIESTDACHLIQNLLKSSRYTLYILHIQGSYLRQPWKQYLLDLIPLIPRRIRHLSCLGGDELNALIKKMPYLESFDLYSAAIDASSSSTMAILRSVPTLERVDFILDSPTIDFGPEELIKYFEGLEHVMYLEIYVCEHIRRVSPLKLWDKEKLDEVKEVARAGKIKFLIIDS